MTATVGRAAELARFDPEQFAVTPLLATEHVRVLLAALEPGQQIPVHAPAVDLVLTVADGVGELLAGDVVHPLHAGDVAVVSAGTTRALRAGTSRLVVVNVVTPPPSAADHADAGTGWPDTAAGGDPAALIRAEHGELRPHLDHLRRLADEVESGDEQPLRERLAHALRFLRDGVLAHAELQEQTVYPAAERLLRALGGATRTMVLEHELIAEHVDALARLAAESRYDAPTRGALRRTLTVLHAVLDGHFAKEEQVYLPLVAHLQPAEATVLADALAAAAPEHAG
jgi:quercetin dioxygenase-like cupin family protein/iron-sulfur cluster repair protein YtfE (RIC family)